MQPGADEVDYRETADVTEVHGAVKREHREPEAGTIPVPLWLFSLVLFVTFGAAFYFGQYNGGFSGEVFNEREGLAASGADAAGGAEGAAPVVVESLAEQGLKIFNSNCASCHQASGEGAAGMAPPLAGSAWINGGSKRVTMIVLKGLHGPLHGKTYNNTMAAWGATLNDKRIAAALSYVRSAWGNSAGEVTPEQVAAVRAEFASRSEPFSEDELKEINGDIEAAAAP
ncbi:MAG TPA: cytochrome c [Chthoniobacteraceae bacterium]|nr:cytochrome c [Chthoniobacteraceae bacterium]